MIIFIGDSIMKRLVLTICCVLVLFSSTAIAIMGPPVATLKDGQFELGVGFSKFDFETAEMPTSMKTRLVEQLDSEWTEVSEGWITIGYTKDGIPIFESGDVSETGFNSESSGEEIVSNIVMKGFDTSTTMFRYSGGVYDNFNLDFYLGGSKLNSDGVNPNLNLVGGAGIRFNLYQKDRLTIGTIIQWRRFEWSDNLAQAKWTMDYNKFMFAVGPAYEITDNWLIYAGPYYSIVNGKVEVEAEMQGEPVNFDDRDEDGYGQYGTRTSSKESRSTAKFNADGFGIVLGTEIVLDNQLAMQFEADLAEDNSTLGANISYRF